MGWVERAIALQEKRLAKVNAQRPVYEVPLRKGWTFVGSEVSAFPPPGYDWEPAVVRAIHEVAPDCQPIWISYLYQAPKDELGQSNAEFYKFGRHGLARVVRDPKTEPTPLPIKMPSHRSFNYWGFKMQKPNKIETVFKGEDDPRAKDLPGAYIPFGWWVYYFVKNNWREWTKEEIRARMRAEEEAHYEAADRRAEESEYVAKQYQKYAAKKLAQISEVELKEYLLSGGEQTPSKPTVVVG
jgi:hypothetical protein